MGVVIGVDPHRRSDTALVLDANEKVLDRRRFANDKVGYRELKTWARTWKDRTWAAEGARGVGLSLAQRLAVEGEPVLNVPAKMSAQIRVFGGGSGRRPTTPTRTPSRSRFLFHGPAVFPSFDDMSVAKVLFAAGGESSSRASRAGTPSITRGAARRPSQE